MGSSTAGGSTLVDLGKELTCSICTEILYQPLTLLDCLHTFCGSCLKSWFSWQSSNPQDSNRPQYTCPSCRASVRDTRHDAKVNTLLDLFLQSDPRQAKSAEEKKGLAVDYKLGDPVLPEVGSVGQRQARHRSASDDEDERLLAEVRDLSLREVHGGEGRGQHSPRTTSRIRERPDRSPGVQGREQRLEDARRRRRTERRMNASPAMRDLRDTSPDSRRVEHQSSLRSLIGSTGESAIEDEILRQIAEEGLLDGIDLHSLTPTQEDELTERIAQAFRRRHRVHSGAATRDSRQSDGERQPNTALHSPTEDRQQQQQQQQERPASVASASAPRSRDPVRRPPPASRPRLLDPSTANVGSNHRRSTSDQGTTGTRRRRTSPAPSTGFSMSSESLAQPTAHTPSSTVITGTGGGSGTRTGTGAGFGNGSGPSRRRASNSSLPSPTLRQQVIPPLQITPPRRPASPGERQRRLSPASPTFNRGHIATESQQLGSSASIANTIAASSRALSRSQISQSQPTTPAATTTITNAATPSSPPIGPTRRVSNPVTLPTQAPIQVLPEPSISCERCGKDNIQYELHKFCKDCKSGNYCLCTRCYRLGRGCLHWFGFGQAAQYFFEKNSLSLNIPAKEQEQPHRLQWRKYLRPSEERSSSQSSRPGSSGYIPPSKRVQIGKFCDICEQYSDDCFWECKECNDGEWGFCNKCVNQDKCCTHPLLPVTRSNRKSQDGQSSQLSSATAEYSMGTNSEYRPLAFSTQCNLCTYPIPPSTTRFHCSQCNDGDYDVCTNCYLKLGASGKISKENSRNGWRRCLQGHRMIIVGFEDHRTGQMRVIVQGLVGGHAWKDDYVPPAISMSTPSSKQDASTGPSSPTSELNGSNLQLKRQDSGRWTWTEPAESSDGSFRQRRRLNRVRQHFPDISPDSPSHLYHPIRFPPSGGIGLRLIAKWSHYPEPGEKDEIMFPRGAEITEAENINDDWFWGCYAGQKGFLPGAYVLVVEEVTADGPR